MPFAVANPGSALSATMAEGAVWSLTADPWHAMLPVLVAPAVGIAAALCVARYRRALQGPSTERIAQSLEPDLAGSALVLSLAAGLLALSAVLARPHSGVWVSCLLGWWLLILSAIDFRLYVLPDPLTLGLIAAGAAFTGIVSPGQLTASAIGALAGYLIFALLGEGYRRLRGHDGLGLGDAKLLAAIGAWLGWRALPEVIFVAALCGLAAAVLFRPSRGADGGDRRIPFGPCLAGGAWLVWLHGGLTLG